jgi:LPXTG-motif cell wall-anchored protein
VELVEVVTPPPAPTEVAANAPASLPHTASQLPLTALLGLLALGAALAVRRAVKRLA